VPPSLVTILYAALNCLRLATLGGLPRTGPTDFIKDLLRTPHRLGSLRHAVP
jgi:hypothetical protein